MRRLKPSDICIFRSTLAPPTTVGGELAVSDDRVREWVRSGRILGHLCRYRHGRLLTERLSTAGRPMLAWVLRLMTRGRCVITDLDGEQRRVTVGLLVTWSWRLAREVLQKKSLLARIEREIDQFAARSGPIRAAAGAFDPTAHPLYLRTDLSFGVRAGGSVGHIAGVVNELDRLVGPPIVVTTAAIPTLRSDVEVHHVPAPDAFWNFQELPTLVMNDSVRAVASQVVADRRIAFVYQRYSLNNFAGLDVARRLRLPFVLEYNGSEIWMARHWGRPLIYESLASRIERLNVDAATLVVVVSDAMRDELVGRGVDPHRILVNPNAVDPDRYNPAVDGSAVTARYGLAGKTVIGFVGTFQPWHGAEVLARAFVRLMTDRPDYRESVRLLLIGSGPGLADVRDVLGGAGLDDHAAFAGLVPQEEGAAYMAACEILVSPHVPNPDGSRFFGSPTKLFEYMAMGKAILASDLEQIGNVLRHGVTGWLVPPGDVEALARALAGLVADPVLRRAMGEAARLEALAEHTWHAHVKRTLRALIARTATNAA